MNLVKKNSIRNKVAGAVTGMSAMATTAMVALANYGTWTNATNTVNGLFTDLEAALKSIVVPIAGVALVFCFIMMLVSQSQKKVEQYRGWCITIVIALIGIYAIPFIIGLAKSIGSSLAP